MKAAESMKTYENQSSATENIVVLGSLRLPCTGVVLEQQRQAGTRASVVSTQQRTSF